MQPLRLHIQCSNRQGQRRPQSQQSRDFYCSVGICAALVKQTQRENVPGDIFASAGERSDLESSDMTLTRSGVNLKRIKPYRRLDEQPRERGARLEIHSVDSSLISQFALTKRAEKATSYNANFALSHRSIISRLAEIMHTYT